MSSRNRRARSVARVQAAALAFVLGLGLAACGDQRSSSPPDDSGVEPVDGGRITIAVSSDPGTLNPMIRTKFLAGSILGVINEGLAEMDESLQFHPSLAKHWTWSEDGLSLTYHLRTEPRWSDGEPFVARDVVKSYELYVHPDVPNPRRSNFNDVESVTAVDDSTVVFRFTKRSPEMIFNTAFTMLPAHAVEDLDPARIREWEINRQPISLGPYQLEEWLPNERLVLRRNPYYYDQPAHLDEVVFKIIPEESVRMLQLAIGEVDLVSELPPQDADRLRDNEQVRVYELGPRYLGYMVYNLQHPALGDPRVRNAISHAIDRTSLIDGIMLGFGEKIASPITPLIGWAYHDGLEPHSRDLALSAELLEEAGWTDTDDDGIRDRDGVPLRFEIKTRTGDPVRENGVLVIRSNLRDVGIDVSPRMLELSTVLQQVSQGDFDAYLGQVSARLSPDLSATFSTGGGFNYGGYSNATVDSLIEAGRGELDRDRAAAIWRRVQEILYDEQPQTMIYAKYPLVGIRSEIRNATPDFLSEYEDIERWWRMPAAVE